MSAAGEPVPGPPGPRLRPATARARGERGGIAAVEAFSRGDVIDREWMGWGALRVLSRQDWKPGAVRDEGRVANMERLLLVTDGVLDADCGPCGRHRVEAGAALLVGTGHGLASRLANASGEAALRLVELWLQPGHVNAAPLVAAGAAEQEPGAADWSVLAAGDGAGPLPLRQAAALLLARPAAGSRLPIPATAGSRCWLEVLAGEVRLDAAAPAGPPGRDPGLRLAEGDGLGWHTGDAAAPAALVAGGPRPASLLLLVLPD